MTRTRLALFGLWALATVLNITKPFHIDDPYYVAEARWIAEHPTEPMSGEIFWITDRAEPFFVSNNSPVLVPFLQGGVVSLFGPSELALHGLSAIFCAIAIALFFALARRLAPESALLLTAIFVLSPSFVAEQNIMFDIPLVAAWLGFFLAFDRGQGERQWWTAAAVAALACMIKFTSFVLIFFMVVELVRTRAWARAATLVVPVGALGAWSAWNYVEYGGVQIITQLEFGTLSPGTMQLGARVGAIAGRAALWVVTLGGVATGLYVLMGRWALHGPHRRWLLGCGVGLAILFPIGIWLTTWVEPLREEPWQHTLLRGAFFMVGLTLFAVCAWRVREGDDDDRRLAIWIVLGSLFIVVLSPFVAARHMLVILPAVLLLVARHSGAPLSTIAWPSVAVASVIGVWLSVADHRIATMYQERAASIATDFPDTDNVYFVGHWGWQHYAEEAGLLAYVPNDTALEPGDVLVEPEGVHAQTITDEDRARLVRVDRIVVPMTPADLVRSLIDREGLYSVWKGLPWTVRTEPLEHFSIYEVQPSSPSSGT